MEKLTMIECPRCRKACKNKRALNIHWGHKHRGDPPENVGDDENDLDLRDIPPAFGVIICAVLGGSVASQMLSTQNVSAPLGAIVAVSAFGLLYFGVRFRQIQKVQGLAAAGSWAVTPPAERDGDFISFSEAVSETGSSEAVTSEREVPSVRPDDLKQLQTMDEYEFEYLVAEVWSDRGWSTQVTQASNDRGVDIVAEKEDPYNRKAVIQAKRYQSGNKVGSEEIQQYSSLKQQEPNVDEVIVVTSSSFTEPAKELAAKLNVKRVNGQQLLELFEGRPDETVTASSE